MSVLKFLFCDHNGKPSTKLVFSFVWHIITIITFGYFAYSGRMSHRELLWFAAGMAGVESFLHNMRRGQDRKAESAIPRIQMAGSPIQPTASVRRLPDAQGDGGSAPEGP